VLIEPQRLRGAEIFFEVAFWGSGVTGGFAWWVEWDLEGDFLRLFFGGNQSVTW